MTTEEKIWSYLKVHGLTDAGAAGLMGNLYAESGLRSNNLQNRYEGHLGMADDEYTERVDKGEYTRFANDGAGYGLCQWTYHTRKAALLEYAKVCKRSIGDLEMQLDFLARELVASFPGVLRALKTATSVRTASDKVLLDFERPADQSEAVKAKRAGYGQSYYIKYAAGKAVKSEGAKKMNKKPVSYLQTDSRWASKPYRVTGENATIGDSGCGPSCAAMLLSTLTGKTITPVDTCAWSVAHGYKAKGNGTYYAYFAPQFAAYGIKCWQLNWTKAYHNQSVKSFEQVVEYLKQGYYAIALMGPGTWTGSGHFVVLWWADGNVHINDPASTRANRTTGNLTTFKNEACYYWIVDAREYNNNGKLTSGAVAEINPENVSQAAPGVTPERKASGVAQSRDSSLAGTYVVTPDIGLNIRNVAGAKTGRMVALPKGTRVQNYGYYTAVNGVKWLYIQVTYQGVKYTGFCSGEYLRKV